jgi:magnesium chelatase subunit I
MTITTRPRTIGELRATGYKVLSVKEEMRKNLIQKIRDGEDLFPGIVGYEETVIPQIENAILWTGYHLSGRARPGEDAYGAQSG